MDIAIVHLKKTSKIDFQEALLLEEEIERLGYRPYRVNSPNEIPSYLDAAFMRIPDRVPASAAEEAAWQIWDRGVPFLINPLQRRVSRNKLYTHRLWDALGIKQPRWSLGPGDFQGEVICKPLGGGRSEGVAWFQSPPKEYLDEPFLTQEYRAPIALWRTIATPDRVILAYKKVSDEKIIAVSSGAKREFAKAPDGLLEISKRMARSLGGGIWGCDVIEDKEGFWALEVNLNFGFPFSHADEIAKATIIEIEKTTSLA